MSPQDYLLEPKEQFLFLNYLLKNEKTVMNRYFDKAKLYL